MSKVKRYMATCDCMSEASWGDYVRHEDYVRLEKECAHVREERDSFQRVGILTMEERDAALSERERLRELLARKPGWIGGAWSDEVDAALGTKP